MTHKTFEEVLSETRLELQEAVEDTTEYLAMAVTRVSKDDPKPVASDKVELTQKQVDWLKKNGKEETIKGDHYIVLDRELKAKSKIKTPRINVMGRTSGYTELFFKDISKK